MQLLGLRLKNKDESRIDLAKSRADIRSLFSSIRHYIVSASCKMQGVSAIVRSLGLLSRRCIRLVHRLVKFGPSARERTVEPNPPVSHVCCSRFPIVETSNLLLDC